MKNMRHKARYQQFLMLEFGALAVLIASLFWLGQMAKGGATLGLVERLVPALASGLVLTGFMGAMYVRWIGNLPAEAGSARVQRLLYAVLAATLLGIWLLLTAQWLRTEIPAVQPAPAASPAPAAEPAAASQ